MHSLHIMLICVILFYILIILYPKQLIGAGKIISYNIIFGNNIHSDVQNQFSTALSKYLKLIPNTHDVHHTKVNFIHIPHNPSPDITYHLMDSNNVKTNLGITKNDVEYFDGKEITFSYALRPNKIYISQENWDSGTKTERIRQNIEEYRKYMILHETLHILGYDHTPPIFDYEKKQIHLGIMFQQTRCRKQLCSIQNNQNLFYNLPKHEIQDTIKNLSKYNLNEFMIVCHDKVIPDL